MILYDTHVYIYIYYIYETSTCFGILHLVSPLAVEATSKSSVTAEAGVEAWGYHKMDTSILIHGSSILINPITPPYRNVTWICFDPFRKEEILVDVGDEIAY
jgi:hypothetical protein